MRHRAISSSDLLACARREEAAAIRAHSDAAQHAHHRLAKLYRDELARLDAIRTSLQQSLG